VDHLVVASTATVAFSARRPARLTSNARLVTQRPGREGHFPARIVCDPELASAVHFRESTKKEVDMNQALAREILLFEQEACLRILVAEDQPDLRRLLGTALRRDGHEVVEARDGAELLEALASTLIEPVTAPFDLVVCEQTLPGMPGLNVLAGLRSRDHTTPFVLVTDDPAIGRRAGQLGAAVIDHIDVAAIRAFARRVSGMTPAND
jgi:CheY-like chemotaxis protein